MNPIFSTLFSVIFAFSLSVSAQEWISVEKNDNFYTEINSAGYEYGLSFELQTYDFESPEAPYALIPRVDNTADCSVDLVQTLTNNNSTSTHRFLISTSVIADSGGCLIFIKNSQTYETLKIINYNYYLQELW